MVTGDDSSMWAMNLEAKEKTESVGYALTPPTVMAEADYAQHCRGFFHHQASQAIFADITRTLGISSVPDLFAALERKPAYLEAAWELFKDEVCLDALDARTRQIVALAITTNRSGTYLISAFPHAFYLSPMGRRRCETVLSTIRMFQAFSQYLSNFCDSSYSGNAASRNSSQADSSDPEPTEIGHGFA